MKCQKCAKPATFHITDIERGKPREYHFCDEHARQHLAANKYPRQITIVPMVPLTSVGKLDRKKLREWVRGEPQALSGR